MKKIPKLFSEQELELVKDQSIATREVAKTLKRNPASVYAKRKSLGMSTTIYNGKIFNNIVEEIPQEPKTNISIILNGVNITVDKSVKDIKIMKNVVVVNC